MAEAIDSILQQSYRPLEVIVVDDGSTDGTAAVTYRYGSRIRYWSQPNAGEAAARDQGLTLSQGEYQKALQELLALHVSGQNNYGNGLWMLLSLVLWKQRHYERNRAIPWWRQISRRRLCLIRKNAPCWPTDCNSKYPRSTFQ